METVTCMSLEEMEWSISIAEEEDSQECGDVIFLIVMVYSRASTSILGQEGQVFSVAICHDSLSLLETTTGRLSSAVIYFTLDSERLMRILLSSLSHVRVEEDQSQRWSG